MFFLSRRLLLYWIHLLPMVRLCAFLEHQSSSLQTRFPLFSSACDPDGSISSWCFARIWISGFGILFRLFQVQVPCEILDLVDHLQSQLWFVCEYGCQC